jgi:hypothetical protein
MARERNPRTQPHSTNTTAMYIGFREKRYNPLATRREGAPTGHVELPNAPKQQHNAEHKRNEPTRIDELTGLAWLNQQPWNEERDRARKYEKRQHCTSEQPVHSDVILPKCMLARDDRTLTTAPVMRAPPTASQSSTGRSRARAAQSRLQESNLRVRVRRRYAPSHSPAQVAPKTMTRLEPTEVPGAHALHSTRRRRAPRRCSRSRSRAPGRCSRDH